MRFGIDISVVILVGLTMPLDLYGLAVWASVVLPIGIGILAGRLRSRFSSHRTFVLTYVGIAAALPLLPAVARQVTDPLNIENVTVVRRGLGNSVA